MTRGFASGLIWGAVMSLTGAAALSLATPLPKAPEIGTATEAVAEPRAIPTQPAPTVPTEAPVPQDTTAAAPGAPKPDSVAPVAQATDPAAQPQVGGATQLGTPQAPKETAVPPVSTVAAPKDSTPGAAPAAPKTDKTASISTLPAQPSAPKTAVTSGFDTKPEAGQTAAEPPKDDTGPQIAALPQAGGEATAQTPIGTPVTPLTDRAPGASTRLPVAGSDPAADPAPEVAQAAPADDLPPVRRYAARFANPEAKPLMAIVLIDDANAVGAEALSSFPYPLTFALDTADPEAAAKMARHRAAGFEVISLLDLDPSAAPQDAETALEATFAMLDESIGVIEGLSGGIQGNRALSDQVTAVLRDRGYGLITQANGLDTVQKLAAREGVPSAVIFRDFDGAGQSPTVMRRFLDQAAFRAGQGDPVIMLGRVRPDTVSALLLWGLQDRAASVQLAPASAVLTDGIAAGE